MVKSNIYDPANSSLLAGGAPPLLPGPRWQRQNNQDFIRGAPADVEKNAKRAGFGLSPTERMKCSSNTMQRKTLGPRMDWKPDVPLHNKSH